MGIRVRVVLLVLSLMAVAALAVPLALTMADRRTAVLAAERGRQLAALADSSAMPGYPLERLVDRYHQLYGEDLLIVDSDLRPLAARGLDPADAAVATAAELALVDAPPRRWARVLPWRHHRVLTATGIRKDGELAGAVVVAVDTSAAARSVATGWMWVAAGCLTLLLLATLAARSLTRWVLRPLTGLERAVAEMTEGVEGAPAVVAGPPELRNFSAAFNTMAQTVRASLDRQRRLIADASHQLRNPLAAVRLRADSLDDYVAEAGKQTFQAMTAELGRLENLLHQLLRLARAEEISGSRRVGLSGGDAESSQSTDLDDVIQERIAFWTPVAEDHDQRVRRGSGAPGIAARLARHDVEQLLDVALDNALRYAGSDVTVTVSAMRDGDTVQLVVSDDGRGLPEEHLSRAAGRFWRGQDDREGTGLGLAIADEIAAGHGGGISVEKAPEGGLLVRYRLPAAEAET